MSNDRRNLLIVKDSIRRLYEAKKKYKEVERFYNEVKKKENVIISNYMFSKYPCQSSMEIYMDEGADFYTNKRNLRITRQRNSRVIWDVNKLKTCLSKKVFRKITDKKYTITDMDGLVTYLKSCGVDPSIFKKYIDVEIKVDPRKLDQAYEIGDLKKKDIEGCYTVEYGDMFIKMSEVKKND